MIACLLHCQGNSLLHGRFRVNIKLTLNSSQVKIKYEFSKPFHSKLFLKMEIMQKVNNFSDPSTTYKIIIKHLFIRALCSYFNHFIS